jgi:hypothetical protein
VAERSFYKTGIGTRPPRPRMRRATRAPFGVNVISVEIDGAAVMA